ncbi:MAG: capsular biosynthesis protein, partial [Deltaproteobacteria bacterium]
MIDIHSHILPGVDDGPRNWEEAIALCRRIAEEGITTSVATPHLIDGVYDNILSRVEPLVQQLREHLRTAGVALEVLSGAEVDFSSRRVTTGDDELPTLGGSGAVLLEMPVAVIPPAIEETIFSLRARRLVPVIAHPERNELLQENPQLAVEWVRAGALLQLDGDSLLGLWGRLAKRCSEALLRRGLVHALATDAHSVDRRPPRMKKALAQAAAVIGEQARTLVTDGPAMILAGKTPEGPLYTVEPQAAAGNLRSRSGARGLIDR